MIIRRGTAARTKPTVRTRHCRCVCWSGVWVWVMASSLQGLSADDFPRPVDTQPGAESLLTAREAVGKIRVPDGFRVTLFAGEPDVHQPIAITTDSRGRLWVAENYTYSDRETNFDTRQRDRIVILEDRDHDGEMDHRTVFWDRASKLTSLEVGPGGVWALCAPQLLFLPDRDGDDRPDGPPEVLLDGWDDGAVRHNIVNGLKWGPDGWLYGRHGILATSLVGKPGSGPSQRTKLNCAVWRYHPTRGDFDVVAQGTTNSWGFDYDPFGEMFFINTVIGHFWHVIPGAHYRRMYGVDFDPYLFGLIEQTADHFHWDTKEAWNDIRKGVSDSTSAAGGGHAHSGLMIYKGGNWPAEFHGDIFTVNYHGRRLNRDKLHRRGAGYVATHGDDFLFSDDVWFRGIDLISGNDGGVYVADWSDIGECHDNDGIHRSSGRIFKVTYGRPEPPARDNLATASDEELIGLLSHPDEWYARQALPLLQDRAASRKVGSGTVEKLQQLFARSPNTVDRLRALWALNAINVDADWLRSQRRDPQENVRAWIVRLLADRGESQKITDELVDLAAKEESPLVLLHLASTLQRLEPERRWALGTELARHGELAEDLAFPLMVWYGIEASVAHDGKSSTANSPSIDLLCGTPLRLVRRNIARRLASDWESHLHRIDQLIERLPQLPDEVRIDSLSGMQLALVGLRQLPPPPKWQATVARLKGAATPEVARLLREIGVVFGDGRAISDLRATLTSTEADPVARQQALRGLVQARDAESVPLMLKLVSDRVLTAEIIRGLASFDRPEIPDLVLGQLPALDPEGRAAAIETLIARGASAEKLLGAVRDGRIRRTEITAYHARQILALNHEPAARLLGEVWGEVRDSDAARRELIARVRVVASEQRLAKADTRAGGELFQKNCAGCHVLFGRGKHVGPDLTGANRRNLEYLLENILDPSASVAADFRMQVYSLADGRVISGVALEQNEQTVRVQTATEPVVLRKADLETVRGTSLSLMPDGLFKELSDNDRLNLLAYLMASGPPQ
ncbi:MAG: c-type cytochrome [Planctomycetes bacterium]|nr:c-type cytochrome [Planctomycetota bacterium]